MQQNKTQNGVPSVRFVSKMHAPPLPPTQKECGKNFSFPPAAPEFFPQKRDRSFARIGFFQNYWMSFENSSFEFQT